jgi:hypothetical protein
MKARVVHIQKDKQQRKDKKEKQAKKVISD